MSQPIDQPGLPIKAQYRYSADEIIRALKAHLRCNSAINRFIPYLGGILIFGFFFVCYKQDLMSALPLLMIGIFFASFNVIARLGVRYRFRKNPSRDTEISWVFSADKIYSEGDGFDQSLAWRKIFRFIDSPKGFLIYPQKGLFYWIPFSGFKNDSEIECVRQIAKSEVTNYKRFK